MLKPKFICNGGSPAQVIRIECTVTFDELYAVIGDIINCNLFDKDFDPSKITKKKVEEELKSAIFTMGFEALGYRADYWSEDYTDDDNNEIVIPELAKKIAVKLFPDFLTEKERIEL